MHLNHLFGRSSRQLTRAAAARAVVEPVETRMHCDGSFGNAVSLGAPIGLIVRSNAVDNSNVHDFYKITTTRAGRLSVTLDQMSAGNADLFLYNGPSSGNKIGSSQLLGTSSELIDKASVPAGTYYFEVRHLPGAQTSYRLSVQTDFAGNDLAHARSIGVLGTTEKIYKDFVGNDDGMDYYKFTSSRNGLLKLKLDGLSGDADLFLYDGNGVSMKYSNAGGSSSELIFNGVRSGTYYVAVQPQWIINANTNYSLHLTNLALPSDGGVGESFLTARDLGALGSKTLSNYIVNKFDTDDYYRFHVAEPGTITLKMTGLAGDLDIGLLDPQGNTLAESRNYKKADESIAFYAPAGGDFYVHVFQGNDTTNNGDCSPYTLKISAPLDTAGNTRLTAKKLNFVNGDVQVNGFVGAADADDWYKVNVIAGNTIYGGLTGLSADADLQLLDSNGNIIQQSLHFGTTDEQVSFISPTDATYYLRVHSYAGNNTMYHLEAATGV